MLGPATKHHETFKAHFGKTLRKLSEQAGSVNHVCKELGINRQQFAKYLSGQNVPSAYILQRLIDHFDVDPTVFFLYKDQESKVNSYDSDNKAEIKNGYYLEYAAAADRELKGLVASAWRVYSRSNVTRCHGEVPLVESFQTSRIEFARFRGTISRLGHQCLLRASMDMRSVDSGKHIAFTMSPYELSPPDWLALRIDIRSDINQISGQASLFRYAGDSPDIVDLLASECGYFPEGQFNEKLAGIRQIISDHVHLNKNRLLLRS